MAPKPLTILILAAGKGTRMKSATAKVLHPLLGRSLLDRVLDLARTVPASTRAVVVGHQAREVAARVPDGEFAVVHQRRQRGTGDAVRAARRLLRGEGDLLILSGDAPLLLPATLRRLVAAHRRHGAAATLLTAALPDPAGYGRILRGRGGAVAGIVEHGDATPAQRRLREVNAGVYCFDRAFLRRALGRLGTANRQGELYLTDVVALAAAGAGARAVTVRDAREIMGVNDRVDLWRAGEVLRERRLTALMRAGVTIVDPPSTLVEDKVRVGRDTVLYPGTILEGATRVGAGCRVGPFSRLVDSVLGRGAAVRDGCLVEGARLAAGCVVGPFAHLRPGTVLAPGAKVGNFVEVKASRLGAGTKASHLSYLGDAVLGRGVNVGAGTITCNYDGARKWPTIVGDGAFIGSDTQFVAPVRVGRGALIGAGSTITRDVPPGALALSRTPQQNRPRKLRRRLPPRKR